MPFASKAQQREARSMGVKAADSTVTSTSKPELHRMPQDKHDLKGGSLGGKATDKNPVAGGILKGLDGAKTSTISGKLNPADGSSTFKKGGYTEDSPGKGRTSRESIGRTGETFTPKTRSSK